MDKKNSRCHPDTAAKATNEVRLTQARAYAAQFRFETLSEEDLKKLRRNAYAYLL